MRILITNDDGIAAPGLAVAEEIGRDLAGPDGEVWVVAPAFEQSGVSHCISYVRPMRLEPIAERRFAVEGSPADCVLAGLHEIMRDAPPDLVLSGVNRGHNVAEDTVYSGTVGGAMEGALNGARAIAMSQYFTADSMRSADPFAAARAHAAPLIRKLLANATWRDRHYGVFYNLNFPGVQAAADVKGVKATVQGARDSSTFGVQPHTAPNGRNFLWLTHTKGNAESPRGSDARECHDGYVTVTPLRADLTAHEQVEPLARAIA